MIIHHTWSKNFPLDNLIQTHVPFQTSLHINISRSPKLFLLVLSFLPKIFFTLVSTLCLLSTLFSYNLKYSDSLSKTSNIAMPTSWRMSEKIKCQNSHRIGRKTSWYHHLSKGSFLPRRSPLSPKDLKLTIDSEPQMFFSFKYSQIHLEFSPMPFSKH